ncbi:MAG TPA: AMP-binding protein [Actinomycetota bacterium]|nr:AMP-binding protein [Actinomycetota bacterium]
MQGDDTRAAELRGRGWWRDETPLDDLRAAVARHPDKPAVVTKYASGAEDVVTFEELARVVDRFAAALLELGVRRGEPVVVQLPNGWRVPAAVLACARVGAVVAPLPVSARRNDVEHALVRTGARVCVVPDVWRGFDHAAMVAEIAPELTELRHTIVWRSGESGGAGAAATPGALDLDADVLGSPWERSHPAAELDALEPAADDHFQIAFTSGTTGEPKGVLHTYNTLHAAVRTVAVPLGLGPDDVLTTPHDLTAQAGFCYSMLMGLELGATTVQQEQWSATDLLDLVDRHGVTFFYGAPVLVVEMTEEQEARARALASLRYVVCGSAPVPPHLVERTHRILGVPLLSLWGMTENGAVTLTRPDDPPDWAAHSDGRAEPWMELRIVDRDGRDVSGQEQGRLLVRGASQCVGYFGRPDLYDAATSPEGWFDTGDLARWDGRGGIRICGRLKDVIVRDGYNVPAVELENALYSHPLVRDVTVVGVPDDRLGEAACAVVVARGERPTLEQLLEHLAGSGLAEDHVVDRLEFFDELPRTRSGKVKKHVVLERLTPA